MVWWKELRRQRPLGIDLVQLSNNWVASGSVLKLPGPQHPLLLISDDEE